MVSHGASLCLVITFALACPKTAIAQDATPRTGFPVTNPTLTGAGVVRDAPALADLDGNGKLEIIFGTIGAQSGANAGKGLLYVLNNDGTVRTGWPKMLPSQIASSPAVGDIDGDGIPDIVVGCGGNTDLALAGGVFAFKRDGTPLWSFSPNDTDGNGQPDHVWSTPALGDIDGDGILDVVFGSFDFYVYALKGTTGQPISGWPVFARDSVWCSPALADLDGDGKLEIIIGADAHYEGPPINTQNGGVLWVFRSDGTQFPGFPRFVSPPSGQAQVGIETGDPVVGDIDGDGCPEIIVGTAYSTSPAEKYLYAWHNDGTVVTGWPVALSGHVDSSPALADLDGDRVLDVVVTDDTGRLYAIKGDGTFLPGFPTIPKTYTGASAVVASNPVIASYLANSPAIFVGNVGFDVAIFSKTGTQISANGSNGGLIYVTGHPVGGPAVGDLDGDGKLWLVAASAPYFSATANDAAIFAWKVADSGAAAWPQYRRDAKRTGSGSPAHVCPIPPVASKLYTLPPCRVSDSRNSGNGTYGGPWFTPGEQRTITYAGVCGIPWTARSVALNVTAVVATAPGDLRFFPAGNGSPVSTTIYFPASRTRANNIIVPLSYDGRGNITIQADLPGGSHVDVVTDVFGYFR